MKKFFATTALLALSAWSATPEAMQAQAPTQSAQVNSEADGLILIDLVVMNEGKTLEQRQIYETAILAIAERYGVERVGSYNITEHLGGKAEDAIKLNLWSLPNAETMQQLGEDLDYQVLEAKRNALHDFSQLTLYTASSVQDSIDTNADLFLVDLVVMNDGYGLEERNEYEAAILPIAEKNGLQRTHFYEALHY